MNKNKQIKFLKTKLDEALSFDDISKAMNGKVKVITYPELEDYETIDELLEPYDKVVVLYMVGPNFGHYVSLFRRPNGNIEVHDPYGKYDVDMELKFCSNKFNKGKYPYLSKLIYESPYKYEYNDKQLQVDGSETATCGKHAINRLLNTDLSINQYCKIIKSYNKYGYNPDLLVCLLYEDLKNNNRY